MTAPVLIRRTGRPALRLDGFARVAAADSRAQKGPRQNRWHELELWGAPTGTDHCLVIRYLTEWEGELGHEWAEILPRDRIAQALRDHDPCEYVEGYPDHEHYVRKQEALERALRSGYEHAVSELLEAAKVWELGDP